MFLIIVLCVMIVDLLIPFAIALPYKGYSHLKTVMSVLGCKASPLGWVYNIWMIISGCTIAVFGYILFTYYYNEQAGLAIVLFTLLFIYGIGDEVISGIFPLNEKKDDVTVSTKIHGVGSVIGFITLLFAPLILAIIQFNVGVWYLGFSSVIFFLLSLIAFTFFVMGDNPKFQNKVFALEGLWQRVLCCLMYAPFIIWIITSL
ncbi:DUF998 domain-containing protein [Sedimentibacter sp. MB31-C6]|uniref:DUF998 domain-containing protein n=1 Tax=Sedimentibacter sp. MB31-C6 TaxID=3109366 RepID=UPI002DDD2B7D|nr:DUF998 domain-containing protein [Sedimentibacter sp. MB36-C1]WSI03549.1 DUF998 domain-containing protein [Sedimentibacter sp. MB36-C1]